MAADSATIMVGGALNTCSSYSPDNCQPGKVPNGKQTILYKLDEAGLQRLAENFQYLANQGESDALLKTLIQQANQLAQTHPQELSYSALKTAWNMLNGPQFHELNDAIYYALTDSLEISQVAEQVAVANNQSVAASQIVAAIGDATLEYARPGRGDPSVLVITAAGRDPYESADFYQQLLQFDQVTTQWLPLTPALVDALRNDDCANLDKYRRDHQTFSRQHVYPQRTAQEQQLCQGGSQALVKTIESATTVMFNGGDQSLTRKILFDTNNQPYPWTAALRERPVIAGTSAGTAIQSGGRSDNGPVPMVSNGSVFQALTFGAVAAPPPSQRCKQECSKALHPDTLTYHVEGGLGRITNAIMDTHFSERDRSVRLHVLTRDTGQTLGYGVDETTALMLFSKNSQPQAQVIGAHGVVKITPTAAQSFLYSYYPAGTALAVNERAIALRESANGPASGDPSNVPVLSQNLLDEQNMRSVTQQICQQRLQHAEASHTYDDTRWEFTFDAKEAQFATVSSTDTGCAIENLTVSYNSKTMP